MNLFRSLLCLIPLALLGCSGGDDHQWEVTVENQGKAPVSCVVTLGAGGGSTATLEGVPPGKPVMLTAGDGDTFVHTIKIGRGADMQELQPDTHLGAGMRCAIVLDADGNVAVRVSDK